MANEIITTLHPDQDPDTNLYPNIKKDNIPNKSIDMSKVGDDVKSLLDSINELQPSGTDTSTNILAFTTNKGIYIATDNGHWYYWDGTHYVDGGVYQATQIANGDVTELTLDEYLLNKLSMYNSLINYKWIDGKFIDNNGNLTNDSLRCVTDYIPVIPDTTIQYSGESNNAYVNVIEYYTITKSKISGIRSTGSNYTLLTTTIPSNCYHIRLSTTISNKRKSCIIYSSSLIDDLHNLIKKSLVNLDNTKLSKIHNLNLYNKNTSIANNFINNVGGVSSANGYYASDYIFVSPNTTYRANNYGYIDGAYYGFYDINKKVLSTISKNDIASASGVITTPDNCYFVRITTKAPSSTMFVLGDTMPSTYVGYTDYLPIDELDQRVSNLETIVGISDVYIYTTDTEEEIFNKLVNAKSVGNCNVHWEYGTYNFDNIFDIMKNTYGYDTAYELPIGNGCKYYFNNSIINATYTGNDNNVGYNASAFGTRRSTSGNFELHDGTINVTGIVYCVHDEGTGGSSPYIHKYLNMKFNYITGTYTSYLSKCIGGGSGLHGKIIIDSCILNSDNGYEVSWHGYQENSGVNLSIDITNCYFTHGFSRDLFYTGEQATLLFSANSYINFGGITTNWTTYLFSNTQRS